MKLPESTLNSHTQVLHPDSMKRPKHTSRPYQYHFSSFFYPIDPPLVSRGPGLQAGNHLIILPTEAFEAPPTPQQSTTPAVSLGPRKVQSISSSSRAFAAILENGRLVTWGEAREGGNSSASSDQSVCGRGRSFVWERVTLLTICNVVYVISVKFYVYIGFKVPFDLWSLWKSEMHRMT